MIETVLVALLLLAPAAPHRIYHDVTLGQMVTTQHTHVRVEGTVEMVRREDDGDYHVRISDGKVNLVLEIVPAYQASIKAPKKGMRIRAWGIARFDGKHHWPEVHPCEGWEEVK